MQAINASSQQPSLAPSAAAPSCSASAAQPSARVTVRALDSSRFPAMPVCSSSRLQTSLGCLFCSKWTSAKHLCCPQASGGALAAARPILSRRLPLAQEQHTVVIRAHAAADRTTHSGAARAAQLVVRWSWCAVGIARTRLSCCVLAAGSSTSSTSCATETLHTTAGMLLACRTPATGGMSCYARSS